jgi:hypothetical protein
MNFKLLKYVNNIFFGGGSSAIVSVGVFYVWPKTTLLLPMWPREAKRLDTPALHRVYYQAFLFTTSYVQLGLD